MSKKELDLIEHFSADHKLILKNLKKLQDYLDSLSEDSNLEKATELLDTMKKDMKIHFKKEEEILFPALNRHFERALKKMGTDIRPKGGPVNVMLLEHKSLWMIIQNLEQSIKNEANKEITSFMTQLAALLRSHIFREENVLYVVADAKIKEKEKAKISARLRKLSKKMQK